MRVRAFDDNERWAKGEETPRKSAKEISKGLSKIEEKFRRWCTRAFRGVDCFYVRHRSLVASKSHILITKRWTALRYQRGGNSNNMLILGNIIFHAWILIFTRMWIGFCVAGLSSYILESVSNSKRAIRLCISISRRESENPCYPPLCIGALEIIQRSIHEQLIPPSRERILQLANLMLASKFARVYLRSIRPYLDIIVKKRACNAGLRYKD